MVERAVGGGHGGTAAARLDHGSAAGLALRQEDGFEPVAIVDNFRGRPSLDLGVGEIDELRITMVAPNGDARHVAVADAGFLRQRANAAVVVEAGHGGPAL